MNCIDELFGEPEANPFKPDSRYRSGMQELLDQMYSLRGHSMVVKIDLLANTIESDLQDRVEAALGRHCRAKVDDLER